MSMAVKSRPLNLDELLRLKWLLGGATALVSLWTIFFLDIEALGLVLAATAAIVAVLLRPALPGRIAPRGRKLAVPAIIVWLAVDAYLSPDTLPVLIRLTALLVLYRTVAYRRKREDLQLLVLGLFLIVVAGVLTVSVGFAFLLLLFTACALGFLFVINLIEAVGTGTVRTTEAETAWTRLPWRPFLTRLRAVADWRLIVLAGTLFAVVVAMSGLLFLVIPRFELASGFFLDRYITRKSRSGFTDTVRFGDVTELIKDEGVAMRVDLTDASDIRQDPYWRLVVLDEYGPEGFKVSTGLKNELLLSEGMRQQVRGRMLNRPVNEVGGTWTFYVEPGVSRYLPLPGSFGVMRLRDYTPVQENPAARIVALRTEPMTMTAFQLDRVELGAQVHDAQFLPLLRRAQSGAGSPEKATRADPMLTLVGPQGTANERVIRRILAEITGGEQLPAEEFGRRASDWLRARHAYTLAVRIPDGEGDSIVRWLDSNEPGFCEYFAAGFAVLARAAGHPTRVVAGFHGGALNAFENYYMVRNSHAHAWAEIHDGRSAWLRVDPTPVGGAAAALAAASGTQEQDSSWSARLDSLRVLWYRRIVNFDSRQQIEMIDQVKTLTAGTTQALRARLDAFAQTMKAWLAGTWDWKRAARVGGSMLGVAAAGWLLWRVTGRGWNAWRRWRHPHAADPVRQAAGRWLGKIADGGSRNAEWEKVRGELQRLRYGPRETWAEPRGVFKRARRMRKMARR
ncbi:MAG TPA: DUF3488 and transglutaminase-like domain-containing protein [Lacunisphaera sp.]|nr:DUF3488 and transglutaminase-like domain-containing protein [Lacunisphaera sp.]